ncbi:MAG: zinc-binding dehydrogenase [Clostridia bacterium]|nr:zinc-binding dehydrogenase [Clostridia bacterium]
MNNLPEKIHFGAIHKYEDGSYGAEMHECAFPEVGPEDIVIKMATNNICTTDYQQWMGLRDHQGFPMAAGHEFAGTIFAKGENVLDSFEIGMQVGAMHPFCGKCHNCRIGHTGDCTGKGESKTLSYDGFYGTKRFADYIVCDQRFVVPINNAIAPAEAGFLEPVATVVQGVKKAGIKPMEDVVVIGAGTMGLVNAQVAKAFGARVIITEIDPKKIARAKEMKFADVVDAKNTDPVQAVKDLTGGVGADCVIAAVGATIAYKQGYQMLKPLRGRLVIFPAGYPKPELQVDPNELHYRKIEIIGTFGCDLEDWIDSATLISKKLINCSYSLEGKVFPLREINEAYKAAATPGAYRVTVDLQGV